jgi:hypothetical protein
MKRAVPSDSTSRLIADGLILCVYQRDAREQASSSNLPAAFYMCAPARA